MSKDSLMWLQSLRNLYFLPSQLAKVRPHAPQLYIRYILCAADPFHELIQALLNAVYSVSNKFDLVMQVKVPAMDQICQSR